MGEMKRHVGKISNTDKRCVIVFMQIPEDPEYALIIDTEALPERWHEGLMSIVEHEGQKFTNLADLLARRIMPDTNMDILNTLHHAGRLQKVPVANVIMYPLPNHPVPLTKVIEAVQGDLAGEVAETAVTDDIVVNDVGVDEAVAEASAEAMAANPERFSRIQHNQDLDVEERRMMTANNLLIEAEMLAEEADRKRSQAYGVAPELKPAKKAGRPSGSKSKVKKAKSA